MWHEERRMRKGEGGMRNAECGMRKGEWGKENAEGGRRNEETADDPGIIDTAFGL